MNMIKIVKTNRPSEIITLELSKSELEDILNSVDCMTEKEQRKLLENIPSTEEGRTRLDKYKALKEDLKKIFETVSWNVINENQTTSLYYHMVSIGKLEICKFTIIVVLVINKMAFFSDWQLVLCGIFFSEIDYTMHWMTISIISKKEINNLNKSKI